MKYGVEMGSGAMICIPSFIKDRFRHSEVDRWEYTDSKHCDLISILLFIQNKESRPKTGDLQFAVHEISALFATSHSSFVFMYTYC
jgi:hypothetical protein